MPTRLDADPRDVEETGPEGSSSSGDSLAAIAARVQAAVLAATSASVVSVELMEPGGRRLESTRLVPGNDEEKVLTLPRQGPHAAERRAMPHASEQRLHVEVRARDGSVCGHVEVLTAGPPFEEGERAAVRTAADLAGCELDLLAVEVARDAALAAWNDSEERFTKGFHHSPVGMALTDDQGRYMRVNPAFCSMLGRDQDALIGASFRPFTHPEDLEVGKERLAQLVTGEVKSYQGEKRYLKPDGAVTHALVNTTAVSDAGGGLVYCMHQLQDVTERKHMEDALRTSEERFRALVQHASDIIIVLDAAGAVAYASPAAAMVLGERTCWRVGATLLEGVHRDDRSAFEAAMSTLTGVPGGSQLVEMRVSHADGGWLHVEALLQNLLEHPAVNGMVVTARDVTRRRQVEMMMADEAATLELIARGTALTRTLERIATTFEELFDGSRCALIVADERADVVSIASPSLAPAVAAAMTRVGPRLCTELVGDTPDGHGAFRDLGDAAHGGWQRAAAEHGLRGCWTVPIIAASTGTCLGVFAVLRPELFDLDFAAWDCARRCIRLAAIAIERDRTEEEIRHKGLHDQLTGLPNRLLFVERLQHVFSMRRRTPINAAVLFLDLDRFKVVNDSLGHGDGDQLLVAVAKRLCEVVRPGDTVARFGGDEFVVLCEGVERHGEAEAVAARIADALREPFGLSMGEVVVTASVGIALIDETHSSPGDLLRDADAAMYEAKELGRARAEVFDAAMRARAVRRLETEGELRRAIEREEFRLLYQPIFSMRDGMPHSVEALVRWQHPQRGLVAPAEFISVAEDSGLIEGIGDWVLREACRQAAIWRSLRADGEPLAIAVNLSARQLAQPDLAATVANAIAEAGIEPRQINLEITESVLMDDAQAAVQTLRALKQLGVGISIDDFGTGYSSLSYLRRLPVDTLKIDRSFIDGLGRDPSDTAIVSAIIELSHRMSLRAIGEGVETLMQFEELRRLGCDGAQGFIFSRPVDAHAVEQLAAWTGVGSPPLLHVAGGRSPAR